MRRWGFKWHFVLVCKVGEGQLVRVHAIVLPKLAGPFDWSAGLIVAVRHDVAKLSLFLGVALDGDHVLGQAARSAVGDDTLGLL